MAASNSPTPPDVDYAPVDLSAPLPTEGAHLTTEIIAVASIDEEAQPLGRPVVSEHVIDLADSIKKDGLLQPIIVFKSQSSAGFGLVAGRHRLHAIRRLGWTHVSALVLERPAQDLDAVGVTENLQRLNLSGVQLDLAVTRLTDLRGDENLMDVKRGRPKKNAGRRTNKDVARRLGVSATKVTRAQARNIKASPQVRAALKCGEISPTQADELVVLPIEQQEEVLPQVLNKTRDETRALVKELRMPTRDLAPVQCTEEVGVLSRGPSSRSDSIHRLKTELSDSIDRLHVLIAGLDDARDLTEVEALVSKIEVEVTKARNRFQKRKIALTGGATAP